MRWIGFLLAVTCAVTGISCGDADGDDTSSGNSGDVICVREPCLTPEPEDTSVASPTPYTPAPTVDATAELTMAPAATATFAPSTRTGTLEGYVHIGPTCPVVREGEDCDDRPYEADLDVFDAGGGLVTTVRSDAGGGFSATLAPGPYRLVPRTDGRLPYASEQFFFIEAGETTRLDVPYDSGIR